MVLSGSLGALKYLPSDKKWSLLNHPKTALAVSQDKKSVCSDVSGTLGWVEWKTESIDTQRHKDGKR